MKQKMIFLTALFIAAFAFSAEYYVDASRADDTGSATNWATAKQTIQAAVDLTIDGDTVWVTNGVYDVGGAVASGCFLTNRVCITNAIIVRSVNGRDVTVVEGVQGSNGSNDLDSVRGVFMKSGCSLIGITITNGYTMVDGDGFSDQSGGGVFLTIDCVVSNCLLLGNSAHYGGGAYFHDGGMLSGCTLRGNVAKVAGGVCFSYGGVMKNCTLTGNNAQSGGGAFFWSGGLLSDSVGIGNLAQYGGGAYFFNGGTLNNCTLSENVATVGGGGAYLPDNGALNNCILWGNSSINGGNDVDIHQGVIRYTCASDGVSHGADGCITNNPQFMDAAGGDFRLQSNSPCINWGDNSVVSNATDLDGNPRIIEDVVDMGAYEYQSLLGLMDSDGDGILDDWERQHGGNQNPEQTCSNGVNTVRQAYIAGLDPNDPTDFFEVSNVWNVLGWPSVSGRVYSVYWATNLLDGFQPLEANIPWTAGSFIDTNTPSSEQMFYKIEVRFDDGEGSLGGGGEDVDPGGGGSNPFDPGDGGGDDGDTAATQI